MDLTKHFLFIFKKLTCTIQCGIVCLKIKETPIHLGGERASSKASCSNIFLPNFSQGIYLDTESIPEDTWKGVIAVAVGLHRLKSAPQLHLCILLYIIVLYTFCAVLGT